MAPNSPSRRIVRFGVVVVVTLILFFYFKSRFDSHSVVELLRGHVGAPESSSQFGQDELRDVQEAAEAHVKRVLGDLATEDDVLPSTSSGRRAAGGRIRTGIALAGPLPTDVLIKEQQLSASSSSTIASAGSPESASTSGSSSKPIARPPEGTVAGGLWTGGGNKPSPTGSPAAMANPGGKKLDMPHMERD